MMHLEYNWTAGVYQARFGSSFIDIRGVRSWSTLADARADLAAAGLHLGRKTDSRSWAIESAALADSRYAIELEFCGRATRRHVLRFCGEFVDQFESRAAAEQRLIQHWNERQEGFSHA